jgi:hypothetical protein
VDVFAATPHTCDNLLEKSSCFSNGQVTHYNKITLKNFCIFHHFEKSSCFSSGHVAHYNKTTLKNLCKIFVFFTWAGRPLQQDHFKKSLYFSPLSKTISALFTNLKNLRIFHLFEKSSCFSPE